MAGTTFGTNDPRTIKDHSQRLIAYALQNMFFVKAGLAGDSKFNPDAVLMMDSQPGPGDARTYSMEKPLSSVGQGNDGTVVSNEEAGVIENMTVTLGERAHAVKPGGKMSMKRTDTDFDQWATRQLGIWMNNVGLENDIMAALFGLYNASGIETVNELAPSTNRIVYGGQTVAGAVSAAAMTTDALLSAETAASTLCGLQFLSVIRRKAEMATPKIVPIEIDGMNCYPVLLHPYQIKAIKQGTGETAFNTLMKDAEKRGKDNPIFRAASFFYDGLICFEYDRAPMRTGAGGTTPAEGFTLNAGRTATTDAVATGRSVAAGVLLGSHAGVLLWGQKPKYYRTDLERGMKRAETDMIYGIKKTRFNVFTAPSTNTAQEDYGVIVFHNQVVVD